MKKLFHYLRIGISYCVTPPDMATLIMWRGQKPKRVAQPKGAADAVKALKFLCTPPEFVSRLHNRERQAGYKRLRGYKENARCAMAERHRWLVCDVGVRPLAFLASFDPMVERAWDPLTLVGGNRRLTVRRRYGAFGERQGFTLVTDWSTCGESSPYAGVEKCNA